MANAEVQDVRSMSIESCGWITDRSFVAAKAEHRFRSITLTLPEETTASRRIVLPLGETRFHDWWLEIEGNGERLFDDRGRCLVSARLHDDTMDRDSFLFVAVPHWAAKHLENAEYVGRLRWFVNQHRVSADIFYIAEGSNRWQTDTPT